MTVKQVFNTSADLDFPNVLPTLDLDFANSKTLDPRITFTRSSGGSYVGADGFIKYAGVNEPRFDHDPATGESLGLLVEEGRTNFKIWSENIELDFSRASISSIIENAITSPTGTQTADGIVPSTTFSAKWIDKIITGFSASQNICCSVFFKKGVGKEGWFQIYEQSGNALQSLRFNFDTKQLIFGVSNEYNSGGGVTVGYGVIEYPNGWYRLWIAGYPNTTTTGRRMRIRLTNETGAFDFTGDGASSYLYVWGVQCEIGAFPTSYIPTVASTRTRAADNASITGKNFSEWYKQIGYTIFSEHITTSPSSVFPRVFNISTSTDSFRLNHYQPPSADYVGFSAVENNINYADIRYSNITRFSKAKMATTYDLNNVVLYVNGNFVGKDTTSPYPSQNRDRINIGSATPNGQYINSTISRISYYPYTLKDSQLQSLTS
jgi:hypothetical protein